jgi:hypothetical protein
MLSVRDVNATRNITFYIQMTNGLIMEWDFVPYAEWKNHNLYWLDQSALLPISIFDTDGDPFPNGTKIFFDVDNKPEGYETIDSTLLTLDASKDDTRVYVSSISSYTSGDSINIFDDNNIQSNIIKSLGQNSTGYYVDLGVSLLYNFTLSRNARMSYNSFQSNLDRSELQSVSVSMIDATPIYRDKNLDPSLLQDYDITPVDKTETYEGINKDVNHIRNNVIDIPTIDGYALARILPITEDNQSILNNKEQDVNREIVLEQKDIFPEQIERNEGDLSGAVNASTTITTTTISDAIYDYSIDSPVRLFAGIAESSMSVFSMDLERTTFEGFNVPAIDSVDQNKLYAKKYDIYPTLVLDNDNDDLITKQFFNPFEVYFSPSVNIYSEYTGTTVKYLCPQWCTEGEEGDDDYKEYFQGYTEKTFNGVYAANNSSFTMDYVITEKNALMINGKLTINV